MTLFTKHPHSIGETYGQHLRFAAGIGGALVVAGAAALVHAVFPFWFERTASRAIQDLYLRTHGRAKAANMAQDATDQENAA